MPGKQVKTVEEKVIAAAFVLAQEKGWAQTGLQDIATKADLPLNKLYEHFDSRHAILAAYNSGLDKKVLENHKTPDSTLSPRERLFDLLMDRFDILNEDREALISILHALCLEPKQGLYGLPYLGRSMRWMLEASGINTCGTQGKLKIAGLTLIYLNALRIWMRDDSPDMGKTMAGLDKSLGRAEGWAGSFGLAG